MHPPRIVRPIAIALIALAPGVAQAEPASPTAEVERVHYMMETSLASTYVFRGAPQYRGKADPSSQSTLGLTIDDLGPGAASLTLWNATALDDFDQHGGTQLEIDVTAAYLVAITGSLSASAGYTAYLYPEGDPVDGAHELFAAVALANPIATPRLSVYAELVRMQGAYATLGLSRDIAAGPVLVTPVVSIGVSGYDGIDVGVHDMASSIAARWSAASGAYVSLSGNYAYYRRMDLGTFADRSTLWALMAVGFAR